MNKEDKLHQKRRNLKLVEKYDNDDYSRFSGPDYSDSPFEIGVNEFERSSHQGKSEISQRPKGSWHHPGVSGKTDDEAWLNQKEYREQIDFRGFGPKDYKRSDDRIYEEVCETLMSHPKIDASNIGVKVESGVVYLSGKVSERRIKKLAELVVEDLPGVQDVRNELTIIHKEKISVGPESATKKDLGIN